MTRVIAEIDNDAQLVVDEDSIFQVRDGDGEWIEVVGCVHAAEVAGVAPESIRNAIRDGDLKGARALTGKRTYSVSVSALELIAKHGWASVTGRTMGRPPKASKIDDLGPVFTVEDPDGENVTAVSVAVAAQYFGVPPYTIRQAIRDGDVPSIRPGPRLTLIPRWFLKKWEQLGWNKATGREQGCREPSRKARGLPEGKRYKAKADHAEMQKRRGVSHTSHSIKTIPSGRRGGQMTKIIAEIGINHNGSVDIAKQLISMAKECGCDAVKFQKRSINVVYSKEERDKPRESPFGTTNGEQKWGLEFGKTEYDEIARHCWTVGIEWFASAWDIEALEFLHQYPIKYNKIASAMLTHDAFVDAVIAEGKLTFVSTGMDLLEKVSDVAVRFQAAQCPFVLMHCVAKYPCDVEDLNLSRMLRLREIHAHVGYSGHEVGVSPSVAAAAMGAEWIERHITLDRSMYGSDQSASLERPGLRQLVADIRQNDIARGTGVDSIAPGVDEVAAKLRYW